LECEICGSKNAKRKAKVEGSIVTICDNCIGFGEEIPILEITRTKKVLPLIEEPNEIIITDFNEIIRNAREKMNLTQEKLAKKLNEKVSLIKRVEDGWEPPPSLISKFEKFFNIKLTEKIEEKSIDKKSDKKRLTIGDVIELH